MSPSAGRGKGLNAWDRRRYGAILCWRREENGAELAHHVADATISDAVRVSIARLVEAGRPLDAWRLVSISTPNRIYRDLTQGGRSKYDHGDGFEGRLAFDILDELDEKV
jgi:hypothetical protein